MQPSAETEPESDLAACLDLALRLARAAPADQAWTLRLLQRRGTSLSVRRGVVQPPVLSEDRGVHVSVSTGIGAGYACSAELTPAGVRRAYAQAREWAERSTRIGWVDGWREPLNGRRGIYSSPVCRDWGQLRPNDRIELLQGLDRRLCIDPRIVDSSAWLASRHDTVIYLNSVGSELCQSRQFLFPGLAVVAHQPGQTQRCTGGGAGDGRQGGLEMLMRMEFESQPELLSDRAVRLLSAPECPSGRMDLILQPAQMVLQIHESIGHPLELDRILGDERNYAGTSFVQPGMFGHYRYGSDLLNISFDPGDSSQLASYAYDDSGAQAEPVELIRDGILLRPLGGEISGLRAGLPAVACARASGWNRPPIDRMANLNLAPGRTPLADMIEQTGNGVLMDRNRSWSIDDSRNKFQFGCEYGYRIVDGERRELVRNPGYRGVSAEFWRKLAAVGPAAERSLGGTPNCGKGEPNQLIEVGHASPPCRFTDVEIFGGG